MEAKKLCGQKSLGGSLAVPNVRELAKKPMVTVPSRYVLPDQEPPARLTDSSSLMIPVIDMQKLLMEESAEQELERLHCACKVWGFFQLVNHGVDNSLVEGMKSETHNLFKISLVEKKNLWQTLGDLKGFGQAFVVSEDQKLDWADLFYLITLPTNKRNPYYYENLPNSFRENFEHYSEELQKLALTLLQLIEKALKLEDGEITSLFSVDGYQSIRTNYYPPCPQPDLVIGFTPHADPGGLTILLQANEAQGLEVRKDGKWVPVHPLPNAFVVNVGDILEMISNGIYRSILHRATVNKDQERMSMAAFHSPRYGTEFGPAKSLINANNPPLYRRITLENLYREFFSRELKDKTLIELMKIKA